jgi:hypothetical protein
MGFNNVKSYHNKSKKGNIFDLSENTISQNIPFEKNKIEKGEGIRQSSFASKTNNGMDSMITKK